MNMLKLLSESLEERFKINAIIRSVREKIEATISRTVYLKYRDTHIFYEGLEYELARVEVDTRRLLYGDSDIDIHLVYFCISKLPKHKRERLEKVRRDYLNDDGLAWNTYKVPLWNRISYTVNVENALAGKINLKIEWSKDYQLHPFSR